MDNDLLARRLRPPSEPPRPQNGHSPLPAEMPAWAANHDAASEVPWDRPADEPWPPLPTEQQIDAEVWPPTTALAAPAPATAPAAAASVAAATLAEAPAPEAPTEASRDEAPAVEGPVQTVPVTPPWELTPAPWEAPESAPWDGPETAAEVAAEPVVTDETDGSPWDAPETTAEVAAEPVAAAHADAAPWDAPAEAGPWDAPVEAEPAFDQAQTEVVADPDAPEVASVVAEDVAQDTVDAAADETDMSVPGQAPWDTPAPYSMYDDDAPDDRSADMLDSYDDMVPMVTRAVAVASAQQAMSDPDDSLAPVLNDVEHPATTDWQWNAKQPEFAGKVVGPTPPADLFAEPAAEVAEEPTAADEQETAEETADEGQPVAEFEDAGDVDAEAAADADTDADAEVTAEFVVTDDASDEMVQPQPDAPDAHDPETLDMSFDDDEAAQAGRVVPETTTTVVTTPLPNFYSTAPSSTHQPMVLRIELAIVDGKVQPVDTARLVGPWSDDADEDSVTVRHPDFEPRPQVGTPEEEPKAESEDSSSEPPAAAAAIDESPIADDVAGPWTSLDPDTGSAPWSLPPLEPLPLAMAEPEPERILELKAPTEPEHSPWSAPLPPWMIEAPAGEPVSDRPVAASQVPAESTRAALVAAAAATAVTAQPMVAQPEPAPAPVQAAVARPAAKADQSDLWFLASEPQAASADAATEKTPQSTLLTYGLTIGMGILVVLLIIAFIYLMTNLLR